jgi:hypothetical protein
LAVSIGTGSAGGVGQPKPNATQCGKCKALYELKTKDTHRRRDRFTYLYSCEQDGLLHTLRVTALLYEGHEVRVLRCEKCAAAFDFNGDRIKALTQFWQEGEAAGREARAIEQLLRHEREALVEDMKRLVDWVQKGRDQSPSSFVPWSRNRDEEARRALAALKTDLPEWPSESGKIMPWVRSVMRWHKLGSPREPLLVRDWMMRTILEHFKIPLVMDYSQSEIEEDDDGIDLESLTGRQAASPALGRVEVREDETQIGLESFEGRLASSPETMRTEIKDDHTEIDLESFTGRQASSPETRLLLYSSALGAILDLERGFVVFGWTEQEEYFIQFGWIDQRLVGEVGSEPASEGVSENLFEQGFSAPNESTPNYFRAFQSPRADTLAELVEHLFMDVLRCPDSYTAKVVAAFYE